MNDPGEYITDDDARTYFDRIDAPMTFPELRVGDDIIHQSKAGINDQTKQRRENISEKCFHLGSSYAKYFSMLDVGCWTFEVGCWMLEV